MIIKFNMAANMSEESDLLNFIYPDYSKVLCDGIMDLYKSKAWTDLALKVNAGCETLVHTFMLSLFAPKLISLCEEDNRCDLEGFNVDQHTISTLLDFIYKGQVTVEQDRLDSIRRGADLMGFNMLSQLISEETKQDSIDSLSIETDMNDNVTEIETDMNEQIIIPSNKCEKPPKIYKDAVLRCSICDFKVEISDGFRELSIDEFKDHLTKVHHVTFDEDSVKISYKCRDCDFEGEGRKALKKHKRSRHSKKKVQTFKCCNCDFVADKKLTVMQHLRSKHPSEKSLKCLECDFHTMSQKKFEAHQKTEHNTGEYVCNECGRKFATAGGKKLHYKRIHLEPEDRNACYLCSFKAKVRADLKQHLADEHNIQRKRFAWPKVYNEKKRCPHCETVLKSKTHLIDHLACRHKVDLDGKPVAPKYKCKSCDFVTYSRPQLHRHNYRTHSKVEFRCDYCEYKCRCRPLLRDHIRWKHFGEKAYMCEVCGRRFITSTHLSVHGRLHTKPSKTPTTTKPMKIKDPGAQLEQFQCEDCEKSFTQKSLLKRHIRRVHDENVRRHQCQLCSYAPKTKWNLAKHVKARHKEITLQVVEEGDDIRESDIAIMEVQSYELVVEQSEPT